MYDGQFIYIKPDQMDAFTEIIEETGGKKNYDMPNRSKRIFRYVLDQDTGLEGELILTGITIRARDGKLCYSPNYSTDVLYRVPTSWYEGWHLFGPGSRSMETCAMMRDLHMMLTGQDDA